jgi:ATP-dependent helicase/nuclease subunit B
MYGWLSEALDDSSQVITANRRLARILTEEFARQQVQAGRSAWRSPAIWSWQDWLGHLIAAAEISTALPTRINAHQSRVLWERCLRREISDPLLNIAMLVRQSRESWARLHEFGVPLTECAAVAQGRDQKIFINAASNYHSILQREDWVDEAGLPGIINKLIETGRVEPPRRLTFAGFDRFVPSTAMLLDTVRAAGSSVEVMPPMRASAPARVCRLENGDAEMRAAGAWARAQLRSAPQANIAIVVTRLEQDADRCARLIREGLTPGWQTGDDRVRAVTNVSYGCQLGAYPAIAVALLALRWICADLGSRDISTLLRSPAIGAEPLAGRCRLEVVLRNRPDRSWTPAMLLAELRGCDKTSGALDWLARVEIISELRATLPKRDTPSKWAMLIDASLKRLNWPGTGSLSSAEFQLTNRWKELLNDVARLELVSPTMTLPEILARLQSMAGESIFQPESESSIVQVLGPLEAAGMQFDKLWITGLSAANWPPAARPSLLISRQLQREYAMPDAAPEDTLDYANRVLRRLLGSANECICSIPMMDGDAEQTVSGLLTDIASDDPIVVTDPGWYAARFAGTHEIARIADRIPEVAADEKVAGGAATLQNQVAEPFTAFAMGRLGVRPLSPVSSGISASLRGTLIHDALQELYSELPTQLEIANWSEAEVAQRVGAAVQLAFLRHEKNADLVLLELLALEKNRVTALLKSVIKLERDRDPFVIIDTERELDFRIDGIQLSLRIDRIDQLDDNSIVILDYKTGARKQFFDRDGGPKDLQLVVYACAVTEAVADLGLFNIDSRGVDIDGAGRHFTPEIDWDDSFGRWQGLVADAAANLRRGDVRLDGLQTNDDARTLMLLSRIGEIRRAD